MRKEPSKHNLSLCSTIRLFLIDIFYKLELNVFRGSLVTITEVKLTPDKRECRVYVSLMDSSLSDLLMQTINEKKADIKKRLSSKMRFKLKYMPAELNFYIDTTAESADRVMRLLDQISDRNNKQE